MVEENESGAKPGKRTGIFGVRRGSRRRAQDVPTESSTTDPESAGTNADAAPTEPTSAPTRSAESATAEAAVQAQPEAAAGANATEPGDARLGEAQPDGAKPDDVAPVTKPRTRQTSGARASGTRTGTRAPAKRAAKPVDSADPVVADPLAADPPAADADAATEPAPSEAAGAPVEDDAVVEQAVAEQGTAAQNASAQQSTASEQDDPARAATIATPLKTRSTTSLIFQAPDLPTLVPSDARHEEHDEHDEHEEGGTHVRSRRRRRSGEEARDGDESPNAVVKVRAPRPQPELITEPQRVKGSTRLEAKKQRRREGRDASRRRTVVTEAEFLARRESVDRVMVVRSKNGRIQIGVLEDGVLVEHYVARNQDASLIGNIYLGRVQNVLPSMEAAFVDIGRGRNAVLYSGEVDWDAAAGDSDTKNRAKRIELALKPGDTVLVQVTKDPVGHKGARLTSQVSLPGRYLVYVPNGSMNGISRKLPDTERARLKKILKEVLPENVGVIVRTAAEGATQEQLTLDVNRLTAQWSRISGLVEKASAPALLHSEPDLLVKIVRDVFNEDFQKLVISGDDARETIEEYLSSVAPDLLERVERYEGERDVFDEYRVSEQIEKALERKVWLPSGGSLVIDRTEAMTVIDVNTGKFVGSGGNLEETVTKNNLEAAEEIVRQLRLRDIGGIIVVDFIDMVLESNRDLVLRRLIECLGRDRTKHQVAEVTSLGLVQMTRKKLGLGLLESFSEPCEVCAGRGIIVHHDPVVKHRGGAAGGGESSRSGRRGRASTHPAAAVKNGTGSGTHAITEDVRNALAQIAASTVTHPDNERPAEEPEPAPRTAEAPAATTTPVEEASVAAAEAAVAILDIPVTRATPPPRRINPRDAELILGSVLDALPEPKKPGQGRGSRRASAAAGSADAVTRSLED